jgi:hypothetical protein
LAGQITSTQAQLEGHIEDLRRAAIAGGDAGALGQAEAQLGRLGTLARRLEQAGPGGLAALKAEVLAANFAAQALAQQSRTVAATAQNTEVALHAAQHDARKAVDDFTRDFYERKIFEKDLRFASEEDERAYREREEQRRREIEKARAEGTAEGDLRAINLSREQLEDAGAHGADRNPAYHRLHGSLSAKEAALKHALAAQPHARAAQEDPLAASAPVALPGDLLATVRSTGMQLSEGQGHGVTAARPTGEQRGLA